MRTYIYVCKRNLEKTAHHDEIFLKRALHLKYSNLQNKAIYCSICDWMMILLCLGTRRTSSKFSIYNGDDY